MSNTILLKAQGLIISPNPIGLPDGGLNEATDVIIKRDNVIEPRRGFKLIGNSFGSSSDRAKQLMSYKNRILRHFNSTLQFDSTGTFDFLSFAGSYTEPVPGIKIRSIEANSNFYFTTSDGIKKISATSASEFTTAAGYITQAGGPKALDLTSSLKIVLGDQSSWFNQDSAVAYRLVWGIKDANGNIILGTPSERSVIYNPLITLLLGDYLRLLGALDDIDQPPSMIDDGDYVQTLALPNTADATELYNDLLALTTKIDNDILYADTSGTTPLKIGGAGSTASVTSNVATITVNTSGGGDPTQYFTEQNNFIFLQGFTGLAAPLNGAQTIPLGSVTTTTFSFPITTANFTQTPIAAASEIFSNTFRNITQPPAPAILATDADLVGLQNYIQNIITQLQNLPNAVIPTTLSNEFIIVLDITTTATTVLNFTIPEEITLNNFYQLYRSNQAIATGTAVLSDLVPDDELQLVIEGFPTQAELNARSITIEDVTPDAFRGAFLYTNAATGEGILQANDVPPWARDINFFKNVIFYANTRTRHRETLNFLGVANMIVDFNNGITPKITITDGTSTFTYSFVTGLKQVTQIVCNAGSTLNSSGPASYFLYDSATNSDSFYVYYDQGTVTDPAITGRAPIRVVTNVSDTANQIAQKTTDTFNQYINDTSATVLTNTVTVTNIKDGQPPDAVDGNTGFVITTTIPGRGEDASLLQVLLSTNISPAQAVEETAKSFVRIVNKTVGGIVYAYYLSGSQDVPGKVLLEGRTLTPTPFYILANDASTGASFNPDISPTLIISSISTGSPTTMLITTTTPHNLTNLDQVVISASNSTPSIDGLYTITYVSPTTFRIPVTVTGAGTTGAVSKASDTEVSQNEIRPNRIYYSKFQQPEAVPLVNFLDVGAKDKNILRIFPLRDSLFVFKEDGLFRISGETSPFFLGLFDSSCIVIPPDSVSVCNNLIYAWTTQGLAVISESGFSVISRKIDTVILPTQSAGFVSFPTVTWGIGYESDNSYYAFTVSELNDALPTLCYRYSNLTDSWTIFDKTNTCGLVNPADDKLYLGAGDTNFLEQERKNFNRTDYADREIDIPLLDGNYFGDIFLLANVSRFKPGDVITQNQTVSVYNFNSLLKKLDNDPGITNHDYFSTLGVVGGDNLRDALVALATKLDTEPSLNHVYVTNIETKSGSITNNSALTNTVITSTGHELLTGRVVNISGSNSTPSINGEHQVTVLTNNTFSIPISVITPGTTGNFNTVDDNFQDMKTSYNEIVTLLNADVQVAFSNYAQIVDDTLQEAVILESNIFTNRVTLNLTLDFITGPLTIYKAITSTFTYNPNIMGDPLGYKHLSEATIIFLNKAFTNATMSFATDLLPEFLDVPFPGDGVGIFGFQPFGNGFFGGDSDSAPFRTIVPRNCQRCRYITIKFTHTVAREFYSIYGCTISGAVSISTRAYR